MARLISMTEYLKDLNLHGDGAILAARVLSLTPEGAHIRMEIRIAGRLMLSTVPELIGVNESIELAGFTINDDMKLTSIEPMELGGVGKGEE